MRRSAIRGVARAFGRFSAVRRLQPPGRDLDTRNGDVMVISYPRSGNTWVRFILANLTERALLDPLADVQQVVPDIYTMSRSELNRMPAPRILKTHEYFDPRYRRVIYLVRDPRHVAISYFDFQRKSGLIPPDVSLDDWVARFVGPGVDRFGNWQEHVQSWIATRGESREFLLVRYEDLLAHGQREARRLADFLGMGAVSDEDVQHALARSSMNSLKKIQSNQPSRAHPSLVGVSHGARTVLPPETSQRIEAAFRRTLLELRYI